MTAPSFFWRNSWLMCSHISLSRLHIEKVFPEAFWKKKKTKAGQIRECPPAPGKPSRLAKGHTLASCQYFVVGNIMWRDFLCSSESLQKVRELSILPTHRVWHSQIYCDSGIHDISLEFTLDDKESRNMIMKSLYINISLLCTFFLHCFPSQNYK